MIHTEALSAARHALIFYAHGLGAKRMFIFTDPHRQWLAEAFRTAAHELDIAPFLTVLSDEKYTEDDLAPIGKLLEHLGETDLVLSVFSKEALRKIPFFLHVPNLKSPPGFRGYTAVIRPRYNDVALLEHLQTDPASVEKTLSSYRGLDGKTVTVTSRGGTNLTCTLMDGYVLPYGGTFSPRHAYLPPAELTYGIVPGSANGTIVVDVTVGEIVADGQLIDEMGRVDWPVTITVSDGYITEITGHDMAEVLKRHLFAMDKSVRLVVELGFGLSQGKPCGEIGPDECLQGTCHFGFGNDFFYGNTNPAPVHLDLVLKGPHVQVESEVGNTDGTDLGCDNTDGTDAGEDGC